MTDYARTHNRLGMWEIDPERLQEAMQRAGKNQSQLADEVGLKQPSIGRLLSGQTKTTRVLDLIARKLNTSAAFLIGETDDPAVSAFAEDQHGYRPPPRQRDDGDLVVIEEIDVRYGLGSSDVTGPVSAEDRTFSRQWLRHFTDAAPENLKWAMGQGDSMEPTIRSGEPILIDVNDRHLHSPDLIWACAIGDFGMIKRLRPQGERISILSDNPVVPDDHAVDDELQIIGRVVAVVRKI